MRGFLVRYLQSQNSHYAPIVMYYIRKPQRVVPMLNEMERLPETAFHFFTSQKMGNYDLGFLECHN